MNNKNKLRIVFYSFLFLLIVASLWSKNNLDKIYSFLAINAYKHNNIEQAQEYFEKSFFYGNNDSQQREIYVNSLINSPLTIKSQEKLAAICEDKLKDSASAKAQYFLYDLMREIHDKYPQNYIKQAPYNHKIIRWGKLPITYSFVNTEKAPQEIVTEINNAFKEWEKQGQIMFSEQKDKNANIIIDFKTPERKNMEYGQKYVVAYTIPIIAQNHLKNMTITFYTKDIDGNNFSPNQIYNTALHEIFHALGFMGHSSDKNNIMYFAKDNESLVNDTRKELMDADITTLNLLYKIKPDITNSTELEGEYLPYLLLGDNEDVNFSKQREAKNYIHNAPTLPAGYIDLAESYVSEEKYPSAIKCLEKALSLSDNYETNYIIYYNLAVSYFYINHFEMALDYVNKAREIKDTEELHYILAEIYSKNGEKDKAKNEYNYLLKISPNNLTYVINLTNLYIKEYNYIQARKILKTYIKNNPNNRNNPKLAPYGLLKF